MILVFFCALVSLFQLFQAGVVFPLLTLERCHSFNSTRTFGTSDAPPQVRCSPPKSLATVWWLPVVDRLRTFTDAAVPERNSSVVVMHRRPSNSCGRLEHSAVELVCFCWPSACVYCLRTTHVFAVCTRVWLQWSRLSRLRTRRLQLTSIWCTRRRVYAFCQSFNCVGTRNWFPSDWHV